MLSKTHILFLFSSLLLSNAAGKCPFGYGNQEDEAEPVDGTLPQFESGDGGGVRRLQSQDFQYPFQLFTCSKKNKVMKTAKLTKQQYEEVAESVVQRYEDAVDRTAFAGCIVRLAGHDLMDFRYNFMGNQMTDLKGREVAINQYGGVDGCVDFKDKDNKGLVECIQASNIIEAYEEQCDVVSLADFIVIASEATMARTSNSHSEKDRYADGAFSLARKFRDQFQYGRATAETCEQNEGLMPDPERGCGDIHNVLAMHVFKYNSGKEKRQMISAILGAHTLGGAKLENSGYKGTWTETPGAFNNDYYRQMLTRGWGPDKAVNGDIKRNQWKIVDSNPTDSLMLNSDLCMVYDNNEKLRECMAEGNFTNPSLKCPHTTNKGTPVNARNNNCCAWSNQFVLYLKNVFSKEEGKGMFCGKEHRRSGIESRFQNVQKTCCSNMNPGSEGDCDSPGWVKGPMFREVLDFAGDENEWLASFVKSWKIATENGHLDLQQLANQSGDADDYECNKLKTRIMCDLNFQQCAWQPKKNHNGKGGNIHYHCDIKSNASPQLLKTQLYRRKKREYQQILKKEGRLWVLWEFNAWFKANSN